MSVANLNVKAESSGENTFVVNYKACEALQGLFKNSYGPSGSCKMLVSGAGDVKISKEGKTLLNEMNIIHPTVAMISKSALGQLSEYGDGSMTMLLFITEMVKASYKHYSVGIHPNVIIDQVKQAIAYLLKVYNTTYNSLRLV
jgi:T-complex protein 1 subunit zeta